jgi:hypothetical protein
MGAGHSHPSLSHGGPVEEERIAIPVVYSLPVQQDILFTVARYLFLSAVDKTPMFHQWPIYPEHDQPTGVATHRGHE